MKKTNLKPKCSFCGLYIQITDTGWAHYIPIYQHPATPKSETFLGERIKTMAETVINSVHTRKAHMEQGFAPTETWRALNTYDTKEVLVTTQDPKDFERLDMLHKDGITIVRQYLRPEEIWIIEEPFPAPKTITQEEIVLFLTNGLNIDLESWQEELIRIKFQDRSAKLALEASSE